MKPETYEPADICDLAKASRMLWNAQQKLNLMSEEVAAARVIKELHSERCKQSLARAKKRSGEASDAKSETMARCDATYLEEIHQLANNLESAEKSLSKWTVVLSEIDSHRTLISAQKATLQNV